MNEHRLQGSETMLKHWVVLIGLILLFWALKSAYAVFMPVAASAFLLALAHPLYGWIKARTNGVLGLLIAFLAVLLGFAAFFALVGWALSTIVARLPQYEEQFTQAYDTLQSTLQGLGITLPEPQQALNGMESGVVTSAARTAGLKLQAFLTFFFLILAFVALGLPEMERYASKFGTIGGVAEKLRHAAGEAGAKFRAYIGAISISAAITAVLTALFAFAVGLEFALVFALLSFLMNYIPTIGSVVAVIPPTLFAFVQYDGLTMPLVVFAGFTTIELTVGNYVAPKIEGRVLSIAPTVVLLSIVFWGWLWGVIGALLAVPLTLAIALFCNHFESARWVSHVIREHEDG